MEASAGGMRRRNVPSHGAEGGFASKLKHFDVYAKVHDDYMKRSQSGGVVTIVTAVILAVLFYNELQTYLTVEIVDHILVDTTINQKLPIGLNMTFPHLRCDEVSVDTVDSTGDNQVDIHGDLSKINLDKQGQRVKGDAVPKEGDCLSCMEAADDEHKCCNTCQDLKDAYQAADLPYYHILDTASQCNSIVGCQVHGNVIVNKVGGNVHVALGKSTIRNGKHVHEFNIRDVSDGFNTSHAIHHISFGNRLPGMEFPLDGTTKIVKQGSFMFHYYIKLVPTVFTDQRGNQIYTHQYSVTDSAKNVMVNKGELTGLPGVFLVYEFNPFMMQKSEKTVPLTHFLTSVSAILGGIFTVASMVEAIIYRGIMKICDCTGTAGGAAPL